MPARRAAARRARSGCVARRARAGRPRAGPHRADRRRRWRSPKLEPRPDTGARPPPVTSASAAEPQRRRRRDGALCLGGPKARHRVGLELVNASGQADRRGTVRGDGEAPERREAGPRPGPRRRRPRPAPLRLAGAREPAAARSARRCAEALPAERQPRLPAAAGPRGRLHRRQRRAGSPTARATARSSPSPSTTGRANTPTGFLDVLREKGVAGTFFEIGQEMPGREATMRQILAEGDEIGDHTMNHVELPGLRADRRRRRADRGLHRTSSPASSGRPAAPSTPASSPPPAASGCGRSPGTSTRATGRLPGTGAIYSTHRRQRPARARSSSCTTAAAPASETLAALPQIIDTLRAPRLRASRPSAQLLGYQLIYRPTAERGPIGRLDATIVSFHVVLTMKIAIVGTGISGLVAAHRLHREHEITVYEAADADRRPHAHGRGRRAEDGTHCDRHRLHRLQRPQLPQLRSAAGRARRRQPALPHELLGLRRARRLRVLRHPVGPLRPPRPPRSAPPSSACCATGAASTARRRR